MTSSSSEVYAGDTDARVRTTVEHRLSQIPHLSTVPSAADGPWTDGRCCRHRRRNGGFGLFAAPRCRCLFTVVVAIVLLVVHTSVAEGLAAEADRKSRRRQSSHLRPGGSGRQDDPIGRGHSGGLRPDVVDLDDGVMAPSAAPSWVNGSSVTMATSTTGAWRAGVNGYDHHRNEQFVNPKPADLQIECTPLRSKRYISDGFCTSVNPIVDVVCAGTCLPIRQLPWYAEYIKVWSHTKTEQYRCVDDVVRRRNVLLACDNGETRSYRIRVVRSCKCKRYDRNQNKSSASKKSRRKAPSHPPPPQPPPPAAVKTRSNEHVDGRGRGGDAVN